MFTFSKVTGSATIIKSRSHAEELCDVLKDWAMSNKQPVVQVCKTRSVEGWRIHAKMKNGWLMDVIVDWLHPDPEEFDPFAAFENMADRQESRNGNDYC